MKEYLAEEIIKKEKEFYQKRNSLNFRDKITKYDKIVQHTHKPTVSEQKKQEIEMLKMKIPNERFILSTGLDKNSQASNVSFLVNNFVEFDVSPQKRQAEGSRTHWISQIYPKNNSYKAKK